MFGSKTGTFIFFRYLIISFYLSLKTIIVLPKWVLFLILSLSKFCSKCFVKALKVSKEASLEGAASANVKPPFIVGITVLTSFSVKDFQNDLDSINSIEDNVLRLAKLSFDAGLDGCVCSPWEAKILRSIYKNNFELITPGIRLKIENKDDQNRIMTPYEAIDNGASKLVIGRSISKAIDPNKTLIEICNSIDIG